MSPRSTSAPATSRRHGGETDAQRRGEAARKSRIEGDANVEVGERRLDGAPRVAGDDDDRTRLGRQRRLRDPPHDRLAVEFRHSFVASEPPPARKRDDWPAASTMAPTLVTGRARLRARGDLHQKPADAHRADVRVVDRHARQHALQDPVEAVLLRRARAARRADDRRSRGAPRAAADCRDRPACRTVRCVRRSPRWRPE